METLIALPRTSNPSERANAPKVIFPRPTNWPRNHSWIRVRAALEVSSFFWASLLVIFRRVRVAFDASNRNKTNMNWDRRRAVSGDGRPYRSLATFDQISKDNKTAEANAVAFLFPVAIPTSPTKAITIAAGNDWFKIAAGGTLKTIHAAMKGWLTISRGIRNSDVRPKPR